MINPEEKPIESKEHRRRGGAFDTLAKVMRGVRELVFNNGMIVRDRPGKKLGTTGVTVNSESVFEAFQQKEPNAGKFNLMIFGRDGLGNRKNTNYIELNANSRTGESGAANGQVRMNISVDGEQKVSAIVIADMSVVVPGSSGIRSFISGEGESGGVQIGYIDSAGNVINALVLDVDGIQLFGIPTSNPGGTGKIWNSAGTLKIT